jgi:hypothetical protein
LVNSTEKNLATMQSSEKFWRQNSDLLANLATCNDINQFLASVRFDSVLLLVPSLPTGFGPTIGSYFLKRSSL